MMEALPRARTLDWKILAIVASFVGFSCGSDKATSRSPSAAGEPGVATAGQAGAPAVAATAGSPDTGSSEGGAAGTAAKLDSGGTQSAGGQTGGNATSAAGAAGDGGSVLAGAGGDTGSGGDTTMEWLPSWATTIQNTEPSNLPPPLANTTLRQFVWPTFSGGEIRVQLSNEKGIDPVVINKVHIAMAGSGQGQIDASTDAEFSFQGRADVSIPAGETVWSDALDFPLRELKLTAVSIHFSSVPAQITGHPGARTTSYIASGDAVSSASLSNAQTRDRWYFIDTIEVRARPDAFAVCVLGDSITDGYGVLNEFARWPDFLTLAIKADATIKDKVSVINAGMGANSLLYGNGNQDSGLVRFQRDCIGRPKVKWAIVLHGVNDIGGKSDMTLVNKVTEAYQRIIDQGHEAGILVYGCPITPFEGHSYAEGSALTLRSQINDWVRTSNAFDAVVDLAEAVADPANEDKLWASYSNDKLHPNKAGYEAMGHAVDLSLFYDVMQ